MNRSHGSAARREHVPVGFPAAASSRAPAAGGHTGSRARRGRNGRRCTARRRPARRRSRDIETDLTTLAWEDAYRWLTGAVVPRPIAWVSTTSVNGIHNIAPFSFFNAFGAAPPILGFAPMGSFDRPQKDTLANVRDTKAFVINIATEATLVAMDTTGKPFPADVDEFEAAGLTPVPSVAVGPPRIKESPINFECELFALVPLGEGRGAGTLVLGRAVHLRVDDAVLRDGKIDADLLHPVARMGGAFYARPDTLPFRRSDRT